MYLETVGFFFTTEAGMIFLTYLRDEYTVLPSYQTTINYPPRYE